MSSTITRAAHRERASHVPARYLEMANRKTGNVIRAFPTDRPFGSPSDGYWLPSKPSLESDHSEFRVTLRESAAVAAGLIVLLLTAWLIWGAFAEAASAMAAAS